MARFDPLTSIRRALRELPEYEALEDVDAVAAEYGLDPESVLKLDGNENPYGPSARAAAAIAEAELHRYADAEQRALRVAVSERIGVPPESIVGGAGSDELIDLVFRLFIDEGDRIVTASPTFGMYAFDASLHGGVTVDVPLLDDWSFDTEGLLEAARTAKAVFIPTPNNPTGNALPPRLVDQLLESGALLVLDEAYIEFSSEESMVQRATEDPALIVLRTFSKWGGLAGMRIAYAVMAPGTASLFMRIKQPYNISIASEAAAIASLDDAATLDERARMLVAERTRVAEALSDLGWVHPAPSETNFLLCRLEGGDGERGDGRAVRDALRRRGIFTRYFGTPRLADHIRFSIGLPEQNDRVLAAFQEIGEELRNGSQSGGGG
jgi:histidinol-phosphate aminotransferase